MAERAFRSRELFLPREGDRVIRKINRKEELGHLSGSQSISLVKDLQALLRREEIRHSILGAGNMGVNVETTNEWIQSRAVSNIVEIQVNRRNLGKVNSALYFAEWIKQNPIEYFSITFGRDGEEHTVPTIADQLFYYKEKWERRVYLDIIPIPTELYTERNGKVSITSLDSIQTVGVSLAYKILRGSERDIYDIVQIGLSSDLRYVFDDKALNMLGEQLRSKGPESRIAKLRATIHSIKSGIAEGKEDMFERAQIQPNKYLVARPWIFNENIKLFDKLLNS